MPNNTRQHASRTHSQQGLDSIQRLINGDFGLAKTYWLFGVAVGIVCGFIADFLPAGSISVIFSISYLGYWVATSIGIWNAAGKYAGNPLWALLAKIAVILGFSALAYEFYSLIA